jgi:hypothetical protein
MTRKEIIEILDGQDTWTNAFGDRFGERVCVLVDKGIFWHNGETFVPTDKEMQDLWEDYKESSGLNMSVKELKEFLFDF